ncbi:MAG: type II secretion system F family protein [Chloroflexi bacterium]|nr:type II secretion system F family protein [Chloroflexota bacterium]
MPTSPEMLPLLLSLVIAGSVVLIFIGLAIPYGTDVVQARLERFGKREVLSLEELELSQPFSERVIRPFLQGIARLLSRATPQATQKAISHKLDLAGNPYSWGPSEFLGARVVAGLTMGLLPAGLLLLAGNINYALLFGVLLGLLGFQFPVIWLGRKIATRKSKILRALPDALDLLTISVEAGLGFDAAMKKVTEKWYNELTLAFTRVLAEIQVGRSRRDALRDMADRAEVPELTGFVAAIIQADQLGVSLARVLRIQSEQMRVRRRQRAEEMAQQAPLKMVFPLVFLIFPAMLVIILGPAIPQLRDLFFGGPLG